MRAIRAEIGFFAGGEFLADDTAAELVNDRMRRREHLVRPYAVGSQQKIGFAEVAVHIGEELREFLIWHRAEREDVAAAFAAFIVGGIKKRRLQALGRSRDRVKISRRDRPDDRQYAVALDQFMYRVHGNRRIGLVVLIDHFDRPAEDATVDIDLLAARSSPSFACLP